MATGGAHVAPTGGKDGLPNLVAVVATVAVAATSTAFGILRFDGGSAEALSVRED